MVNTPLIRPYLLDAGGNSQRENAVLGGGNQHKIVKSMLNAKLGIISPKFRGTRYEIRKNATDPPKINMSPKRGPS